jgi:hypothetical protein
MSNLPPVKLAFVIDNEVVEIFHTDNRMAAIWLSEPKVVDVTEMFHKNEEIRYGYVYDPATGKFNHPSIKEA